jgi:hypothetical protein
MHSDVRADVQAKPTATREDQQRAIDRWRQEFNHIRPHQALDGKTPADLYKVGDRRRATAKNYPYPTHFYVRHADAAGNVRFRGDSCAVGTPFAGLQLGVEVVDALRVRVWLHDLDLGLIETLPGVDDACFEAPLVTRPRRYNRRTTPTSSDSPLPAESP